MMHQKAVDRIREGFTRAAMAATREPSHRVGHLCTVDHWLDQYLDSSMRATEWDADQWGFGAGTWMEAERAQMNARSGTFWPKEII